ncbi:glycosyltransferase [Duganella caerulea]|uniref:glycosyltransferase n=1 Tax=Duganella caerulea TaxID=2885762 RepID=UPI004037E757
MTKERAQIPANLPEAVLWQAYVPLSALLPHTAALVHHGGIGTTAEALRAGTPQLVVPFAWDQFDNGARIASLGVGQVIPARRIRPRKLARMLEHLCNSETVRARCSSLASRFMPRPPSPSALSILGPIRPDWAPRLAMAWMTHASGARRRSCWKQAARQPWPSTTFVMVFAKNITI